MHTHTLDHILSPSARQVLLERLNTLLRQGLMLQAHTEASELGDYRNWRGADEMALAARMVGHLGAPRLADTLAILGYRRYPHAAEARLSFARYLLSRRGYYQAWRFLQRQAGWLPEAADIQAEWLSLGAHVHAMLRDFEHSAYLLEQVASLRQDDPWLDIERSYCLEAEDMHVQALELCLQTLQRAPGYRPAIQQAARLEVQLNRRDSALARLREAAGGQQSASLCAQLGELLIEVEALDEAEYWLDRGESYQPLLEAHSAHWYAARRCDIACLRGDHTLGRELARQAGPGFYSFIHERLQAPIGERRLLPVDFVRQHHMTCAPATLSALSAYWGRPAAHLEIAEEICYDGTSHLAERAWAERNGWLAREFTVDWQTAKRLIDRGVPFTLTIQYTGSGHLQAVVGYDEPRGTLLIRDPAQAQCGECLAEPLLSGQAASGPRGMLILPPEEEARLDGLELPESGLWDLYYRLLSALDGHRRSEACDNLELLQTLRADHRLGLQGQRALAWYDGDEQQVLAATEQLLQCYPEDCNLILSKASSLSLLQSRQAQLDWLAQHTQLVRIEPAIRIRYAQLLAEDGRMAGQVGRLLHRALSQSPLLSQAWNALASLRWDEGRREEALTLYRIAACLQGTHEGFSSHYFRALRCLGRTEEGLAFLRARQQRLGHQAAAPTLTLAEFLEELEQSVQVRTLLEEALAQRPDDGELMLALADHCGRIGEQGAAAEVLQRAAPFCRRSSWLRSAVLHSQRSAGDPHQALYWCREAIELEPLNLGLQRMCLDLLEQTQGAQAAEVHLRQQSARFEHHRGLAELQVERAQRQSPAAWEQALRRLLASHPLYAWALRELAVCLTRQGRRDEALMLGRQALEIDPGNSSSHSTLGFVLLQDGQRQAALAAFIQALRLSVDNDYASAMLLDNAASHDEACEFIALIHDELVRQVTFGDGWLIYQQQAQGLLDSETLLQQLRDALQQRSDLWQLWVVTARQLVLNEQVEQAESLLNTAIERFPLLPRLAVEQAQLLKQRGILEPCLDILERSFRVNALWTVNVRLYVEILLDMSGRLEQAEQVLRRVLLRTPDNAELRAYLAHVLGERGADREAADEAERVLREEPGNEWAWDQLRRYAAKLGDESRCLHLARELVQARAGDVDAWRALADQEPVPAEREKSLLEALRLNPRHRAANERLLELLLQDGRDDDLLRHLQAPCWNGVVPIELALFGPRSLHARQRIEEAITELEQLLAGQPNCFVGWRYLADWREGCEDWVGYVRAAREMVRLEAKYAVSHGYLGHALLLAGEQRDALASFERASELDPGYLFAALNAYDLLVSQGDHGQARARLETMLARDEQPAVLLRALRLAQAQGDGALKQRALAGLMTRPDAEACWDEVVDLLDRHGRDKSLREQLAAQMAQAGLHMAAARYWLQLEDARWRPDSLWCAFEGAFEQDLRHTLKQAMLGLLAERENCRGLLMRVLHLCRAAIAGDDLLWGMASYAMLRHDLHFTMFDWLADWRGRTELPAWGLDNLAVALRTHGRDGEAAEVSKASLERDPGNREAMLWLACDHALREDREALSASLQNIGEETMRPYFQCMRHLLEGWLIAQRACDSRRALPDFDTAKVLARQSTHPAYRRLRKHLSARLAFPPLTSAWARPWRYLQLRF